MSEQEDACRPVEIDGQVIRVRGAREMNDEDKAALGEIVRAAQAAFADEPVQRWVLINENCGHLAGVTNTKHLLMAYKIKLTIHGHKGWKVEQRDFTDEEATALLDAERCFHCRINANLRQVIR